MPGYYEVAVLAHPDAHHPHEHLHDEVVRSLQEVHVGHVLGGVEGNDGGEESGLGEVCLLEAIKAFSRLNQWTS